MSNVRNRSLAVELKEIFTRTKTTRERPWSKERKMAFKDLINDAAVAGWNPEEKSLGLEKKHVLRQIVLALVSFVSSGMRG